uniref:BTB domain-containing protein n=1 Tax=Parastrongyloides trichosuri TaxID=131310 RepID=A0A0N4Z4E0_PARTI
MNNINSYNNSVLTAKLNTSLRDINSAFETPLPTDIILQCHDKCYRVRHQVAVANSRMLQGWSNNMRNGGFTVDLSGCKSEAVELALKLFYNNETKVPNTLILDVYRVLVKLDCSFLEENFYNYINHAIFLKNNAKKVPSIGSVTSQMVKANDIQCSLATQMKEMLGEIKNLKKSVNDMKNMRTFNEKKTIHDLPDAQISDKAQGVKLITGKKVYDHTEYKEIYKVLDYYREKIGKKQIQQNVFVDIKLIIDNDVYEVKKLNDLKSIAKYFRRIKKKTERRTSKSDSGKRFKGSVSRNSMFVDSTRNGRNFNKSKGNFKVYNGKRGNVINKDNVIKVEPINFRTKQVSKQVSEPSYIQSELDPSEQRFSSGKTTIEENNAIANSITFNKKYYTLGTKIQTRSNSPMKTSTYVSNSSVTDSQNNFFPVVDFYKGSK